MGLHEGETAPAQGDGAVGSGVRHLAVIMDGNGRWARARHMPRTVGHVRGASVVRGLVRGCVGHGVRYLTLFAFSTENWGRPSEEVGTLVSLFIEYLQREARGMQSEGVRLRVLGDLTPFPVELRERIQEVQEMTRGNEAITLCVAVNYGGRWDVAQAARRWMQEHPGEDPARLTPEALGGYLVTADLPEPDMLIRTGGESRLSNFLLWQCAYSELYFTPVLWPDFDARCLDEAMAWFASRERRFGRVGT